MPCHAVQMPLSRWGDPFLHMLRMLQHPPFESEDSHISQGQVPFLWQHESSDWPMQDIMISFTAPMGLTEAFLYLHYSPTSLHLSVSLPVQILILKVLLNELLAQKSPSQCLLLGNLTYKKSKLLSNHGDGKQVKLEQSSLFLSHCVSQTVLYGKGSEANHIILYSVFPNAFKLK